MRKRLITLLSATLILAFTPYSYGDDSSNPKTPKWQVGARNVDGGSQTYGEVTEQIPQEGASEPGAPPSQEHPDVTASEPSMWDEKPHQKCTDNGDEHPEIHCVNNGLL